MGKLLLIFLLVVQSAMLYAQGEQGVKGKIVDAESHTGINSVSVSMYSTNISTLTKSDGSFYLNDIKTGDHVLLINYVGYTTKTIKFQVNENQVTDLGDIFIKEDLAISTQMGLISLTENDLGDDNSGAESTASILQASKDPFDQIASFNWGQAFFKVRGLSNEYGETLINGVNMNKLYDGRPQYSNWGGLNDATRNQLYTNGSVPSEYTFGGILGTQSITTRSSHIRDGIRIGFSGSNTNYTYRPYAIYSSGLNKDGWSYTLSASYRGAKEGYWEGTNYDAPSFFAAVEKKFNDSHSLNFTAIYASNTRAKNAPLTDEQIGLKGYKYNSYWGDQVGDKRNSRYKEVQEPIFMLTHYWTIDSKSSLTTTASYQFGHIVNSRFGYQDNLNPDPTYYRNMPSYALNNSNYNTWEWEPNYALAADKAEAFKLGGQIDWANIYAINEANNGQSKVILYEDRQQDNAFDFVSDFRTNLTDHITFNAGINYKHLSSANFKKSIDLLGGNRYLDIDNYQTGDERQSDLNNPNRLIGNKDKFGYNYNIFANTFDVYTQFIFDYNKVKFYIAQNIGYTAYEREGLYKNGIYKDNSYGKSGVTSFNNFGFKGGAEYHFTGRYALSANIAYYNQAPTYRNTFANARINNVVTKDLTNEDIFSSDVSFIVRTPKFKARATAYLSELKNGTEVNFYYADGAGITDQNGDYLTKSGGAFVSEILTGVNKRNLGIEIGAEYQITQTIKATAAASLGQSFYTNNPTIRLNSDNVAQTFDYGKTYLKNTRESNGPQTALSLGLEYRSPDFWWIGANVNYFDNAYVSSSALRRTDNFVKDPDNPGQVFPQLTESKLRSILKQEKLAAFTLVNLTAGKSYRLPNRTIIGLSASVNNLFNYKYKTGGFEQARNANYKQEILNSQSGVNTFANKYFLGYGRNFFINLYYNF